MRPFFFLGTYVCLDILDIQACDGYTPEGLMAFLELVEDPQVRGDWSAAFG